jgi:hypothetical protein
MNNNSKGIRDEGVGLFAWVSGHSFEWVEEIQDLRKAKWFHDWDSKTIQVNQSVYSDEETWKRIINLRQGQMNEGGNARIASNSS